MKLYFFGETFEIEVVILVLKPLSDKYLPIVACNLDTFIFVKYINSEHVYFFANSCVELYDCDTFGSTTNSFMFILRRC